MTTGTDTTIIFGRKGGMWRKVQKEKAKREKRVAYEPPLTACRTQVPLLDENSMAMYLQKKEERFDLNTLKAPEISLLTGGIKRAEKAIFANAFLASQQGLKKESCRIECEIIENTKNVVEVRTTECTGRRVLWLAIENGSYLDRRNRVVSERGCPTRDTKDPCIGRDCTTTRPGGPEKNGLRTQGTNPKKKEKKHTQKKKKKPKTERELATPFSR